MRGMDKTHPGNVEPPASAPLQFGIRDLLILQTVCALCLGLLVMFGIFAVMAIFVGTLAFCALRVRPENVRLKRCVIDLMGGIVLPALCIVYFFDPSESSFGYIFIAMQMLALLTWLIFGSMLGRTQAVVAGILSVGATISLIVAVPFFFLGVFGTAFYGIGLLGFTPLLACYAFLGNMDQARRHAHRIQNKWVVRLLFLIGVGLAIGIPLAIERAAGQQIADLLRMAPWPTGWRLADLFGASC
jgi:hypothetical protein